MSKKVWIIFIAIVVLAFGGLVYQSSKGKLDVSGVNTNTILPASDVSGNIADHVFGDKNSKVILVEYGDFQCPGCAGSYVQLKTLSEKYKDKMAFVFRNFPLTTLHPNARAAAAVAEAAGLQGKYWEMHDALYQNQENWQGSSAEDRNNFFSSYAKEIGINVITFQKDLSSASINQKILFDQALGKKVGVTGTPTVLLNGEKLSEDVINDLIQAKGDKLDAMIKAKIE